jgi:rubredoxin
MVLGGALVPFRISGHCPGTPFRETDVKYKTVIAHIRFKVFAAVILQIVTFWVVRSHSTVCGYQFFEECGASIFGVNPEDRHSMLL